ncbi:AraC family transcriptional regulator [Enhydrobacter sp.]|jgi:AraC-like DNA-binding protein|uniref:AraC family transcriptional regulator n=1 Tax=Enhydrobacter sp. TaxID=1894999 RepID=UPI002606E58A|nr:AraC family transcriptional regulator [Enhydrobacter sp.]WIM09373.1 MAG: Transcriptional regulator, AraC family [Enhydrobacter sp.]
MTRSDEIRFDAPRDGLQRLSAQFAGHAYDLHRHETYGVGLTLSGAQSFHYRGALRTSRAGQVMVLHPDETHDGHAGVPDGFAYRMLYVEPAAVGRALAGAAVPYVPDVVADDAGMALILREAFTDFPRPLEPLAVDAIVARLAELLAARSDAPPPPRKTATARRAVERARDFLIAEAPRIVASEELESVTGLDRFALARHFRAAYATSPHRFQVGRRLARAQTLIARGQPLSEVAAATGFADQSHLTRHFSSRFGLTPGRWAALTKDSSLRSE